MGFPPIHKFKTLQRIKRARKAILLTAILEFLLLYLLPYPIDDLVIEQLRKEELLRGSSSQIQAVQRHALFHQMARDIVEGKSRKSRRISTMGNPNWRPSPQKSYGSRKEYTYIPPMKELMAGKRVLKQSDLLFWVDLEMTGLNIMKDRIIEIACLITDGDLKVVAEGPNIIIQQPKELMDGMDDWCTQHHGESGLTASVLSSNISTKEAEDQVLSFLEKYCEKNMIPLAGNSVHADKAFLLKEMPRITNYLHYRIVDVSSVKELAKRWYPSLPVYKKKGCHRALDDIKESIEELRFYRGTIFK